MTTYAYHRLDGDNVECAHRGSQILEQPEPGDAKAH